MQKKENNAKKQKCKERQQKETWSGDFAQALDESKSRLVATWGETMSGESMTGQQQKKKKPLHSDFP